MFGKGGRSSGTLVAVAEIGSGSAGVALFDLGASPRLIAIAREGLSLEERPKSALQAAVIQQLTTAVEKVVIAAAPALQKSAVSKCYCIVGSPWTHSHAGTAHSQLEHLSAITDAMVGALAKQSLAAQKDVEPANVLEANVVRVLLNGYPTDEPAAKRAQSIDLYTLISDCDVQMKTAATDTLKRAFPAAQIVWRSSARALLAVAKVVQPAETCLIVDVGTETTDLVSIRKGILGERVLVEQGERHILNAIAKGKPAEETLSLMRMLETEQCETDACNALRDSIAKAEPDLAHAFGEAFAKLSTPRKLPESLILIASPALQPWLSRFFSRIDFTQFTATTRPFTVTAFNASNLPAIPRNDTALFADPGLSIAAYLVNMESADA